MVLAAVAELHRHLLGSQQCGHWFISTCTASQGDTSHLAHFLLVPSGLGLSLGQSQLSTVSPVPTPTRE